MSQEKIEILKDGEMILAEIIRKNTKVEKKDWLKLLKI